MQTLAVIVPNYNHAKYLPDCLGSIFSQSRLPDEVVVIDDASTDHSIQIIESFQQKHPILRLVRNQQNRGVIHSVNEGIRLINSDYVAFCAADDMVLDGFFSTTLDCFSRYPEIALCCSDPCQFSGNAPYHFQRISLDLGTLPRIILPRELHALLWKTAFWIPSHSTVYRREEVVRCGGFDKDLKHLCDWFLNYQIALQHPIGYIPYMFGALRIVEGSYGAINHQNRMKRNAAFAHLLDRIKTEKNLFEAYFSTGLLGQLGVAMIEYLLMHPQEWQFLPKAFKKKSGFLLRKIYNSGLNYFSKIGG